MSTSAALTGQAPASHAGGADILLALRDTPLLRDLADSVMARLATISKIVLPTAIAGLVTGVTLAIARVIGETAPIFIAASFTDNLNTNAFFGPMSSLATIALTGYKFPSTDIQASLNSAWGAALLLIILVVILNLIARIVARVFAPKGLR